MTKKKLSLSSSTNRPAARIPHSRYLYPTSTNTTKLQQQQSGEKYHS